MTNNGVMNERICSANLKPMLYPRVWLINIACICMLDSFYQEIAFDQQRCHEWTNLLCQPQAYVISAGMVNYHSLYMYACYVCFAFEKPIIRNLTKTK